MIPMTSSSPQAAASAFARGQSADNEAAETVPDEVDLLSQTGAGKEGSIPVRDLRERVLPDGEEGEADQADHPRGHRPDQLSIAGLAPRRCDYVCSQQRTGHQDGG
jgi:hypothetical protein